MAGSPERIYFVRYTREQGDNIRRFYATEWRARKFMQRLASYGYTSELFVTDVKWRRVQ
jgi:hypothetical protein